MKRLWLFGLLFVLGFWLSASKIHALDYNYPLPVLFKNAQDDPSLLFKDLAATSVNEPGIKDYFDNATVTCIDNPTLARSILENDIKQIKTSTHGNTSVSSLIIPNYAMDSEKLLSEPTKSFPIRALTNLWDWYNNFAFQSWCQALNLTDPTSCAEQFGNALTNADGTSYPNILATDPGITKLLSPEQQYYHLVKPRAQEILTNSCCNKSAPCEADYSCGDSGLTSCQAAKQIPNNYTDWYNLGLTNPQKQSALQACMVPSTVVMPGIIVLVPEPNPDKNLFDFLSPPQPAFGVISLSGIKGSSNSSENEFDYLTVPAKQTDLADQIKQETNKPLNYAGINTAKDATLAKINQAGACKPISLDTIFAGSVAPSRLTGNLLLDFFFKLVNPLKNALQAAQTYPYKYSIWVITPVEANLNDYFSEVSKNYLTASKTALMQPINVPLPITDQSQDPTLSDHYTVGNPTPCPTGSVNCPPPKQEQTRLGWSANSNTQTSVPGGDTTQYPQYSISKNALLPLNSPEYYQTCNYYQETAARLPILRDLLGNDAQSVNTTCTDTLNKTMANTICKAGQGWSGNEADLNTSSGCTLSGGIVGRFNIPPLMKQIFEYAGSTNNVPPDLLAAVMYAEGGFEPRTTNNACYGSYTNESIKAASICGGEFANCMSTSCSNYAPPDAAGCDSAGPYQQLRCPNSDSNEFNRCNFYDATLGIAAYLARMSILGNDVHTTSGDKSTSCLGQNYNPATIPYPTSCQRSDWSRERLFTAIRYETGLCHEQHFTDILNVYDHP